MPIPIFVRLAAYVGAVILLCPLITGCNPGTTLSTSLLPYPERIRIADDSVNEAVTAFNKGDQAKGDSSLNRAVILLTESVDGEFNDEGFIEVAKRISAKGRPQDAVRLLEPLTKDERVSGDPRLWAMLAQAARQSANIPRSEEAKARAAKEASAIIAGFGGPIPKEAIARKQADRASHAGQYFDEFVHDYPKTLLAYREAHRLLPNEVVYRNNLGYILAEHGTTDEELNHAVDLTRSVVEKFPDHPVFLDSFGWALYKRNNHGFGDLAGARRRLREAVDLSPEIPECHYHLAVVYEKLNQPQDALRQTEYAISLNPDYTQAKSLRDRLKTVVNTLPSPVPNASPGPSPSPRAGGNAPPPTSTAIGI